MTHKNLIPEKTSEKVPQAMPVEAAADDAWKGLPADSQLISFGDRFTFTFAQGREVGSIHFDRGRGEIFYKGHNIRNMELEEWQMQILEGLRKTLEQDAQGKTFAADYAHTLDKMTMEKKK